MSSVDVDVYTGLEGEGERGGKAGIDERSNPNEGDGGGGWGCSVKKKKDKRTKK